MFLHVFRQLDQLNKRVKTSRHNDIITHNKPRHVVDVARLRASAAQKYAQA